jgi:hypothetical protein
MGQWPPCVLVEILTLHGDFSSTLLENVISLPSSVRELHINSVPVPVINAALQKLGPELTKLQFGNCGWFNQIAPMDMYKVLATCPKLENFHFMFGNRPVLPKNMSESAILPSDYFQNFKRFFF